MRIGVFGGSFNPPHLTHKKIALTLIQNGFVDKVIFVPTGDKYNKKDLVPAPDRYNMIKEMIKKEKYLSVSDYELNKELVYTYQTLDYFQKKYSKDEISFICGADNLRKLNTWKNYKYILDNYHILVINRNNIDINNLMNNKNIINTNITIDNVSSTYIRNNIHNKEIWKNLDKKVYNYIVEKNLYI